MKEVHYVITDVTDNTDYEGFGCDTCGNGMELVGTETLVYEIRDTPTGETLYEQTFVNADLEYGTDAARESAELACPAGKIKNLGRVTAPELSLRLKGQKFDLDDVLNRHGWLIRCWLIISWLSWRPRRYKRFWMTRTVGVKPPRVTSYLIAFTCRRIQKN